MIKSEIFASVLRDVCEVTGISERDIMSKSKSEEIVDARHLLVVTLRRSCNTSRVRSGGRPIRWRGCTSARDVADDLKEMSDTCDACPLF